MQKSNENGSKKLHFAQKKLHNSQMRIEIGGCEFEKQRVLTRLIKKESNTII